MHLPPLADGRILKRYKRFLADVELASGEVVTAHCPNTGAMTSCWEPGARVQLSHSDNPKRKLAWTLERVDMGAGWIGVNTHSVNHIIAEGIVQGRFPSLQGYATLKREHTVERPGHTKSRLDLFLSDGDLADAYIEVKNATLLEDDVIRFPDAVSERAMKHLDLLISIVETEHRGVMLYAINRPEGSRFSPADSIHPAYGKRLREAAVLGVEVIAVRIFHGEEEDRVGDFVEVDLD